VREGNVDVKLFKPLLEGTDKLKLIQNAVYDYEILKSCAGTKIKRLYDTMLVEQLLFLGLHVKAGLQALVAKYLKMNMPKDIANSFKDYNQQYQEYQLRYAANDVTCLRDIYYMQLEKLKQEGLMRVAKLEFDFVEAMAEMELNGMLLDVPQWRGILEEMLVERDRLRIQLLDAFGSTVDQDTLFGVSLINLDSPIQVVRGLQRQGVPVDSTDVKELKKHKKHPIVKLLLDYRKYEKFITTYGEPMIGRIHDITGRLHTSFKQMVSTGRMSSSDPNLQNIPKEQKYRSCFVARPGHKLLTCDMSAAELRIIANLSGDPTWIKIFNEGGDLHTISAAAVFGVSEEEVIRDKNLPYSDPNKKRYRDNSKPISFGLAYGLSEHGLALRLGISTDDAKQMIDKYFK
jgi:DNA polymerase-1